MHFLKKNRPLVDLTKRHTKQNLTDDLVSMTALFCENPNELSIPINKPVEFVLKPSENCIQRANPASTSAVDSHGKKIRHFVRILLLSGSKEEGPKPKLHLNKRLTFLLTRREQGGQLTPLGGEWSSEEDGKTPSDESLRKTAIRTVKELVDVDLSSCERWIHFAEFLYKRENGEEHRVVCLIPNIWDHFTVLSPKTLAKQNIVEVEEDIKEEQTNEDGEKITKIVKKKVSKTTESVVARPLGINLATLLDSNTQLGGESLVEACLFAECFEEHLQHYFGNQILNFLKSKVADVEVKRKRESTEGEDASKRQKVDEATAVPMASPGMKLVETIDESVVLPFQYFDRQSQTITGHVRRETLEGLLHQLADFPKHKVETLLEGVGLRATASKAGPPSLSVDYVKLATTTKEVPDDQPQPTTTAPAVSVTMATSTLDSATTTTTAEAEVPAAATPAAAATPEKGEGEEGEENAGEEAAMDEASLSKMLMKDLKNFCVLMNLPTTGKKQELVERILEARKKKESPST
jgi:hypothetical protein